MTNTPLTTESPEIVEKINELINSGISTDKIDYDEIIFQAHLLRANDFYNNEFEIAADAYKQKFGFLPMGLQYQELTTKLLQDAVKNDKKIRALRLPKGAVTKKVRN